MEECIFCKLSESSDKKVYSNENFFSVLDINPLTRGHSLVVSKKHFKTSLDLPSVLGGELLDCVKSTIVKLMKEDEKIEGFNIINNNFGVAGQVVEHVHFHLIPRRKEDNVKIIG